jgi:hypothetical protein
MYVRNSHNPKKERKEKKKDLICPHLFILLQDSIRLILLRDPRRLDALHCTHIFREVVAQRRSDGGVIDGDECRDQMRGSQRDRHGGFGAPVTY